VSKLPPSIFAIQAMRHLHLALSSALLLGGCASSEAPPLREALRLGTWRMALDLSNEPANGPTVLPFLFDIQKDTAGWTMLVHNATEKILLRDIAFRGDTVHMRMPLFDSEFVGTLDGDSLISGYWWNYLKGSNYKIPFRATASDRSRFAGNADARLDLQGEWEVHFSRGTADEYPALGIFRSANGIATGTFCTETGDYRYLEGQTRGDSLFLSCFDGSHAFLFTARSDADTLRGRYWSGNHWEEPFIAWKHPGFHLRDQDSLTALKEGYDMADFRFPDLNGRMVSPKDARFKDHVLMVQVMGSWCPNCVDETLLLNEMYAELHEQGLDVVALAFERYTEPLKAVAALKHFREELGVKYDILYAGDASKELAAKQLPFLDHIMSYPTCIFIDRAGKVRRIRTGFYGPGTGEHYVSYKRNLRTFLEQLLNESGIAVKKAA
jgi:thiol-disulfide isomerase/thioredoxin